MEMGGNFCQILQLGGTTIKGRRVLNCDCLFMLLVILFSKEVIN